jgi:aminoglycoside phosphotransferase (APT) family kinase protein
MTSPTQRQLTASDIESFARQAFPDQQVRECGPLSGGTFAAVWRVRLSDGRDTVVKVGPEPSTKLLTYEADMITSEAAYYRLVKQHVPTAPVPTVLYGCEEFVFTTFLPGTPLSELDDDPGIREQVGAVFAAIHKIKGPFFGYPGSMRPQANTWPEAFSGMVDALLHDAVTWNVEVPTQRIQRVIAKSHDTLTEITVPTLVHFDLWDGNILCCNGKLTGLVDGERYLYGDPLIDFVSTALFQRIEDNPDHPFVKGYGPVELNKHRLGLYRLYLYLLMHVEVPSRGITDQRRIGYVEQLLGEELDALETA